MPDPTATPTPTQPSGAPSTSATPSTPAAPNGASPAAVPVSNTPSVSTAAAGAPPANGVPPEQAAALERLREKLGLPKPAEAAPVTPATPTTPAPTPPSEEAVLRALAEEQLRLSREKRAWEAERENDKAAREAEKKRLAKLERIEKAQKSGNRRGVIAALHDDNVPEGEYGEWGKEVAVAMSGEPLVLTPEDVERTVERRLAAEREDQKRRDDAAKAERERTRTEANQSYLQALDMTLKAAPTRYPGLTRFGADATRVIKEVEASFATSGGSDVISVTDVLDKLEREVIENARAALGVASPGQQPSTTINTPAGAPQPSVAAQTTVPPQPEKPKSEAEREAEAKARIIARARELMKQQGR